MSAKKQEDFSGLNEYLNKLSTRIGEVEEQSKDVSRYIRHQEVYLKQAQAKMIAEMKSIKKSIDLIKNIIEKQKKQIKIVVQNFKGITKKERLERLQEMINEWGPENLVTREEIKKRV